jgi:hypothetical protein
VSSSKKFVVERIVLRDEHDGLLMIYVEQGETRRVTPRREMSATPLTSEMGRARALDALEDLAKRLGYALFRKVDASQADKIKLSGEYGKVNVGAVKGTLSLQYEKEKKRKK